jgi:hypothetical protein
MVGGKQKGDNTVPVDTVREFFERLERCRKNAIHQAAAIEIFRTSGSIVGLDFFWASAKRLELKRVRRRRIAMDVEGHFGGLIVWPFMY